MIFLTCSCSVIQYGAASAEIALLRPFGKPCGSAKAGGRSESKFGSYVGSSILWARPVRRKGYLNVGPSQPQAGCLLPMSCPNAIGFEVYGDYLHTLPPGCPGGKLLLPGLRLAPACVLG